MLSFIFNENYENLLQDYSNNFHRHIVAIADFTRFLELKGYPGCSLFNKFMRDLDRQIKSELVDEGFIKKQQEIDISIRDLKTIIQTSPNPLVSRQIEMLIIEKNALDKSKASRLNSLIFNRLRTLQEALRVEFDNCFLSNVLENNIPVEIIAAFTLIESQLKSLENYMLLIEKSVIMSNNYMTFIRDVCYSVIPYYQFNISEFMGQSILSKVVTTISKITSMVISKFVPKRIIAGAMLQKTDSIFLDFAKFQIKLEYLQKYIERFQIIQQYAVEKLNFILEDKKQYYAQPIISGQLHQEDFTRYSNEIHNLQRYLNGCFPSLAGCLQVIFQNHDNFLRIYSTPMLQMQSLDYLYLSHLEKHISKAVEFSQLILNIIEQKKLSSRVNQLALQDLLKFINVSWGKEWLALQNKSISNRDKQAILESMLEVVYKNIYKLTYLNANSQPIIKKLLLLEIFNQGFLNCLSVFNVTNNIIKKIIQVEVPNVTMTTISMAIYLMSTCSLNKLDIILRRTQIFYRNSSDLSNYALEPLIIGSDSRKEKAIDTVKHIRIEEKLFLYSSGGGGHREAKNAKIVEAKLIDQPDKSFKPLERDLMLDWVPADIGKWSTDQWNEAQKRGDILKQEELVSQQYLADIFFGPFIFLQAYTLLESNPQIREIVDTQAVCNKAVCQAVLEINKKYARNIKISLIMTDLPTNKAVHFWNGLKTLSVQERSVITLECMEPLIPEDIIKYFSQDKSKQIAEFFAIFCGSGLQIIINNQPPIRREFLSGNHRSKEQINLDGHLSFKYNFSDEREVLTKVAGSCEEPLEKRVRIPVQANDVVISVLLGSQGGQAIVDYVKIAIDQFENPSSGGKVILCLYCSADKDQSSKIFREIKNILDDQLVKINENLIVLPLGIQDALTIAENLERDNLAIIRTGGISSFEALVVNQHKQKDQQTKFLLHSESKGSAVEELLSSIPVWERGNAEYLIHKLNARVVNTVTFIREYQYILNPTKYICLAPAKNELKDNKDSSIPGSGRHRIIKKTYKRKRTCSQVESHKDFNPLKKRALSWLKKLPIPGVIFSALQPTYNHNHLPNMELVPVEGDGDCFYHAVRLYLPDNDENTILNLRARVADYILHNLQHFAEFIEIQDVESTLHGQEYQNMGIRTIEDYILAVIATEPSIQCAWADNIQIIALMHVLRRPIYVIDNFGNIRNINDIENMSVVLDEGRPIFVRYNGHNHYDGLRILNSQQHHSSLIGLAS